MLSSCIDIDQIQTYGEISNIQHPIGEIVSKKVIAVSFRYGHSCLCC